MGRSGALLRRALGPPDHDGSPTAARVPRRTLWKPGENHGVGLAAPHRAGPVLGRYEIVAPLGRGATSTVYRARDLSSDEEVALKAVPVELDIRSRVEREARAAALLSHPALVPILDWGEDDEHLYIVSELIEGEPLDRLFRDRRLEGHEEVLLHALADVFDALDHAHSRGVIHRDVKPANVLLGHDGHARLADLGVADVTGEANLTMTGGLVGTVAYMSPEQARGKRATGASDVYAGCLVLYEGLTGTNPLLGGSPAQIAQRAARGEVPPLSRARPELPQALTRVVELGLARDPAERPPPAVLARQVREAAEGWGRRRRTTRLARSGPALACGAAGALLGAAGIAAATDVGVAPVAAAGLAGGLVAARAPRLAAVAAAAGALALVARHAPGTAVVLGAAALVLVATAPRGNPRTWLAPAIAPFLVMIGLGPLYVLALGRVAPLTARLWAALTGTAAVVAWQIASGADALALASVELSSLTADLAGSGSPFEAARRLGDVFAAHPEAVASVAVFLVFALLSAPVLRASSTGARVIAAVAWIGGFCALQIGVGGAGPGAIEVLLPSCILVAAWAARPWRRVVRRAESPTPTAVIRDQAT